MLDITSALLVGAILVGSVLVSQVLTDWLWRKRYWRDLSDHAIALHTGLFRVLGEAQHRGDTATAEALIEVLKEAGQHPIWTRTRWPWSKAGQGDRRP